MSLEVKPDYRCKRHDQPIREVIVLDDKAWPHTAAFKREKLKKMSWTPLKQPFCDFRFR